MNAPLPSDLLPRIEPRAVPAAMLEALQQRFGERCSTAQAVREQHGRDESPIDAPPPEAVVFCESTDDVVAVVKLADRYAVPVIPFGVGSSLEGHLLAVQGGVSIDLSRMNKILAVQPEDLTVDGAGRRHAHAAEQRDPPHRAVLPDRPGRRRERRRHERDPRQRHQRGALRHDARERARPDGRDAAGRGDPHRHARTQVVGRLRPDAADGRQRRHARRDHRDHACGSTRCPRRSRRRSAPSRASTRRCARRSRSSRWACRSRAANCWTATRCARSTATTS